MATKPIKITVYEYVRGYKYTAHLNAETGKLLKITAGCRTWKTFEDAHVHYRGEQTKYVEEWRVAKWLDTTVANDPQKYAWRLAARKLLAYLQLQVFIKQRRIQNRRRPRKG